MQYNDTLFRTQFPEFADTTAYPAASIQVFWTMATVFIGASGCPCGALSGDALTLALNYMTAQLYTLSQMQTSAVAEGQAPGQNLGGFETAATIDKVSVTVLAPPASDMWEWWLAQTPYGQALLALLKVLAVGGFSVGGLPERRAFRKVGGIFF
jgi:Protein of unknown function (DUF4054)